MTILPLGEQALVEQVKQEQKVGSLYVTGKVEGSKLFHKVLAVGSGLEGIKVGDTVILREYAGKAVNIDGKLCKMIERDEILALVEI